MKICLLSLVLLQMLASAVSQAQSNPVTHNKWASTASMPVSVSDMTAAVLGNQIFVIGGATTGQFTGIVSTVQIYNPATNSWRHGPSLKVPIAEASAATVDNTLYVFGGTSDGTTSTNEVWAYNTAMGWVEKTPMPAARAATAAVVENGFVYVIGGAADSTFYPSVQRYDPKTDTWAVVHSMHGSKQAPSAGLIGQTIIAADGASAPAQITGDTEAYNSSENMWKEKKPDPTARVFTCNGAIGTSLYVAGGYLNNGGTAPTINYSYQLSNNTWNTTLAPMPQGTMRGASAVYQGKLYCIGGLTAWFGNPVASVHVYQP